MREITKVFQVIALKSTKEELTNTEARLLEKITELFTKIASNFFSKEELNKRFSMLNKKMAGMGTDGRNNSTERDDAMFSKKQLGPVACASCEQNLINMSGLNVDYHNWKKMPARETSERIERYGQGFSKILSTLREDMSNANHFQSSIINSHIHDKKTLFQNKSTINQSFDGTVTNQMD